MVGYKSPFYGPPTLNPKPKQDKTKNLMPKSCANDSQEIADYSNSEILVTQLKDRGYLRQENDRE